MPRKDALHAEGTVIETLPNLLVRVELANGYRLLARVSRRQRLQGIRLAPGEKVTVEMSPYDLSKGGVVERPSQLIT